MRTCAKCGSAKSASEFYANPRRKDGLMSACKVCHLAACAARRERDPGYLARWKEKNPSAWRNWYQANREVRLEYHRKWARENPELKASLYSKWAAENSGKVNALIAKRNAAKKRAIPAWANPSAMLAIYAEAARRRKETGERLEVDHIVPLQGETVCGLHWEGNLQIITKGENLAKNNRRWPGMP